MRRLVAALLAALLAVALFGCGGKGGETPEPDATETPAQAPAPAPADDTAVIANRSDLWEEITESKPFPTGEDVPESIANRIKAGKAMLLFFYSSGQPSTDDVRTEVNSVASANKGLIDLISYDLSKNTEVKDDGTIKVDEEKLQGDDKAKQAARLASVLGVDHVPYITIVDEQGQIIFWSRGFIDSELLERQVQRASK